VAGSAHDHLDREHIRALLAHVSCYAVISSSHT
jgi:hypothetical protein